MIHQFEATYYRGLRNFSLGPMRRVNLVTGPNGVGKSSLTEAIWLFHGRYNPVILWNLHVQRRQSMQGINPLFSLGDGHPIELSGREDGARRTVRFEYDEVVQALHPRPNGSPRTGAMDVGEEPGPGLGNIASAGIEGISLLPTLGFLRAKYDSTDPYMKDYSSEVVLGPDGPGVVRPMQQTGRPTGIIVNRDAPFPIDSDRVERFSDVVARGEKRELLDMLAVLRPNVRDIEILSHQGKTSLWADVGEQRLLPVEAVGGGVVRLLGLLVNFFNARGGLIVIDEIENGIHYSALRDLWRQIRKLSTELNVQSVITTHSRECVEAAVAIEEEEGLSELVVHQIYETREGARRSEAYTGDKLMAALDLGFDIR